MNNPWTFSVFAAPALLGTLLGQGVEFYADAITDEESVVASNAPMVQPGTHAPRLVDYREVRLGQAAPAALGFGSQELAELGLDSPEGAWSVEQIAVVAHEGSTYLAVRRTPPGREAPSWMQVLRSNDERSWHQEFELVSRGAVSGPGLLAVDGKLLALLSTGRGDDAEILGSVRAASGRWSQPENLGLKGHRLSSLRTVDGVPLMTTVIGAPGLYRTDSDPLEIRLSTTQDGLSWHPLTAGGRGVYDGGGDDAAFQSGDDGNLLAVVRNEAGDSSGFGSSVCLAPATNWADWDCVNDPKSYGSAALFSHDSEVYLVGQRHLGNDGRYDTGFAWGMLRAASNRIEQLTTGKRCAVWRYQPAERQFGFVMDLPSKGDVCAPAILQDAGRVVIYAHSSELDGPDLAEQPAKQRANRLYRYVLEIAPSPSTQYANARRP